jgi:hypothetical protein
MGQGPDAGLPVRMVIPYVVAQEHGGRQETGGNREQQDPSVRAQSLSTGGTDHKQGTEHSED